MRTLASTHTNIHVYVYSETATKRTYSNKSPYPRPHSIVGQLAPSALMHHCALVHAASNKVYEHGDHDDDAEDAAGAERLFRLVYAAACIRGAAFEEIGAVVDRGDEGDGGFG